MSTYGIEEWLAYASEDTRKLNMSTDGDDATPDANDLRARVKSADGRRSQRKGERGEQDAEEALRQLGVLMVERIATPIRILETRKIGGMKFFRLAWSEKVSGDLRGMLPGGTRVLAEAKSRDRNLRWSDFEEHQREALTKNQEFGGLSLVAFVHTCGIVVLQWPIPEEVFRKGRGISFAEASEVAWPGVQ